MLFPSDGLDVLILCFFFLMIRRPPRSTQSRSSAASDVYKRQHVAPADGSGGGVGGSDPPYLTKVLGSATHEVDAPVSYTHLRAHETVLDLVCRLLLEKKKIYTAT